MSNSMRSIIDFTILNLTALYFAATIVYFHIYDSRTRDLTELWMLGTVVVELLFFYMLFRPYTNEDVRHG